MSKYLIIFIVMFFSNILVTYVMNFFKIEESFFKRIFIFMSLYYISLFSINYFFPEVFKKNLESERIVIGSKIKVKEEFDPLDLNYPLNKEINLIKNDKKDELKIENLLNVKMENLDLFFDISSGSPVYSIYNKSNEKSFVLFDYSEKKIKPFLVLNENESYENFSLIERKDFEESTLLRFYSENEFIKIEKTYLVDKKNYKIRLNISASSENENYLRIFLPEFDAIKKSEAVVPFFYSEKDDFKEISKESYEKEIFVKPKFLGFKDSYFVNLISNDGNYKRAYLLNREIDSNFSDTATFVLDSKNIKDSFSSEINWYFGPKKYEKLKNFDTKVAALSELGWLSFFGKISVSTIEIVYSIVKNYGIAIFIFGLLLKVLTFPIAYSSRDSIKKREEFMKKNKYIQEKYKNDRERRTQEQMELMKKYGVMPGGLSFLANLIQIPFIFSLQRVLRENIDFYDVPFFGWMTNIGLPDKFYILPGIFAFFIYTKLSKSADTPMKQFGFLIFSFLIFFIISKVSVAMTLFILSNFIFSQLQDFLLKSKA